MRCPEIPQGSMATAKPLGASLKLRGEARGGTEGLQTVSLPPRRLARSMKMNGDCVGLTLGGTEQAELWEPAKEAKRRLTKRDKGSQEPGFQVREQDIQEGGSDLPHGGIDQLSHLGKQNEFFPEYARTDQDDLKKSMSLTSLHPLCLEVLLFLVTSTSTKDGSKNTKAQTLTRERKALGFACCTWLCLCL